MEWMILPLKRYADFKGRSRRMEFWMFQLFNAIVWTILSALILAAIPWGEIAAMSNSKAQVQDAEQVFAMFGPLIWVGWALMVIWGLAILVPSLAVTVRRLHDRDMSGWWYAGLLIVGFIPIINFFAFFGYIALLVVMFLPGTDGPNRWGADPKDPSQSQAFT